MTRSQLIANCHASKGTKVGQAVVLTDAVILLLAVSGPTMNRVSERLGDRLVESAMSDDGFCFAVILSAKDWHESLDDVAEEVEGLTYTDNREHPCNNLEGFVWMVSWLEQARQLSDDL
jgi:hypothetical protein